MRADRVKGALRRMGPEERALIELSLIRGVPDAEIASLLGTEPEAVRERRDEALGELAAAAGDGSLQGRATAVEHLRGSGQETGSAVTGETDGHEPAAPQAGERRRGGRLVPALLGGLIIAALAALVLARQDEDPGARSPAKPARLVPLAPGPATGTARLVGEDDSTRLRLSVKGLPAPPKGGYVVWLYNSVSDARSLGSHPRGGFTARTPLPAGYERFRFIDISREPADGNRSHSGQTVLRLSVSSLRGDR